MLDKNVTLIIDLQFGSTGKGLIAGYLAERDAPDTVINANMPNAGHTYINAHGRKWVHKVLPNGIVSPNLKKVMIGPGSVFDMKQLKKEIDGSKDLLQGKHILIHQDAMVLQPEHREHEQASLSGISSTMQGSMAALLDKMSRDRHNDFRAIAFESELLELGCIVVGARQWHKELAGAEQILAEGAQGYSLGLNAGFWPFCTSRDCTPTRFLSDMGIPHTMLKTVVGTARVHPIRVGNTPDGYSGDVYGDQNEISWGDIGVEAEKTTVTLRERRIFTFSRTQIEEAIFACQPDEIFLNFCNYCGETASQVAEIIADAGGTITYLGYGPKSTDIDEV